jgi:5-methylcytosine-specific restriction endonuclease McrA
MSRPRKQEVDYFPAKRTAIVPKKRESVYLKSQGKCVDCGSVCGGGWASNWNGRVRTFELNGTHEIHHVIPLLKGGTSDDSNLILLCIDCHKTRHDIERGIK